jgi:osmotically-inducible protein OsmY
VARSSLTARIERELAERAGIQAIVEETDGTIMLSGRVDTQQAREAAEQVAGQLAMGKRIDNQLELEGTGSVAVSTDELEAAAEPSEAADEDAREGAEPIFPPTDPVITTDEHGRAEILGGFSDTSMSAPEDSQLVRRRAGGDEALADAVRRELYEDAATTALEIEVVAEGGVVRLRGAVEGPEDAENAEAVAARVPGVREVIEELEIPGL